MFIVVCLAAPWSMAAPPSKKNVLLAPKWTLNQELFYKIEKTREKTGAAPVVTQSQLKLVIAEVNTKGFKMVISLPLSPLDDGANLDVKEKDAVAAQAKPAPALPGKNYVFLANKQGVIQRLQNWEAIRDDILSVLGGASGDATSPVPPNVKAQLEKMYANEESTRQLILQDLEILFMPYGDDLIPAQKKIVEGDLPSAAFGPLKVTESYLLNLNTPVKGVMTETFKRHFDAAQITHAIDQYLLKSTDYKKSTKEQLQFQLLIRDSSKYEIDMQTGIVIAGERIREAGVTDGAVAEKTTTRAVRQ